MLKEQLSPTQEPGVWIPGRDSTFFNLESARQANQHRWEHEARRLNSYRPLAQKLSFRKRLSAEDVMRDEANTNNRQYDASYPRIPDFLYTQQLGETILEIAGIEQPYFSTAEQLQDALRESIADPDRGLDSYPALLEEVAYKQLSPLRRYNP